MCARGQGVFPYVCEMRPALMTMNISLYDSYTQRHQTCQYANVGSYFPPLPYSTYSIQPFPTLLYPTLPALLYSTLPYSTTFCVELLGSEARLKKPIVGLISHSGTVDMTICAGYSGHGARDA